MHSQLNEVVSVTLNCATSPLAYIDPGSGSAIISAIVGIFVASALAIKTYWYKLKSFFSTEKGSNKADSTVDK